MIFKVKSKKGVGGVGSREWGSRERRRWGEKS